jgi:hypothetical protein
MQPKGERLRPSFEKGDTPVITRVESEVATLVIKRTGQSLRVSDNIVQGKGVLC